MKAAVYAGTRNVYKDMIPSMKSLLIHSDVDKIYFLIEDDEFPYPLPPEVECINVSNQDWFKEDCINMKSVWGYMVLLRAAYPKIFSNLDMILGLDNDTIVNENISELWDINLDGYYLAGVKEIPALNKNGLYINCGVLLYNLKKMREDKKDDEAIDYLNTYFREFKEQDAFNEIFKGKILELPSEYNSNFRFKKFYNKRKIIHYAGITYYRQFPIVDKYRNMTIIRNVKEKTTLDIIIPFHSDSNNLERALESVYFPEMPDIKITVVDDCSGIDYEDIKNNYPDIQFLQLEENSGPGMARQYGIDHTKGTYIMFLDEDDYICSKYNLLEVYETIKQNNVPYLYLWGTLHEANKTYSFNLEYIAGAVVKREFLELYHITFSKEGSYYNEDFGFFHCCQLNLKNIAMKDKTLYFETKESPIYFYTYNKNGATNINNGEWEYKHLIKGIVTNSLHVLNNCRKNDIHFNIVANESAKTMVKLYEYFLMCAKKYPEAIYDNWKYLREFYFKFFRIYEKINMRFLDLCYTSRIKILLQLQSKKISRININRFIADLRNYEECPY